jgi:hypothetical protein
MSTTDWAIATVDDRVGAARFSSVGEIADLPVIAYHYDGTDNLAYARCDDDVCVERTIQDFDTTALDGRQPSMVIINDLPVIAYQTLGNAQGVSVRRCTNADCTASTAREITSGGAVSHPQITSNGGLPAISYFSGNQIRLAICSDVNCTATPTFRTIATTTSNQSSIGVVNIGGQNRIVVSYYNSTNQDLELAVCDDAACSTQTTRVLDGTSNNVGSDSSLMVFNDRVTVAYRDDTNTALKVVLCTNADCSTFGAPITIDNSADTGLFPSITPGPSGQPWIAYQNVTDETLWFADCGNVSCTSITTEVVDDRNENGGGNDIVNIDGDTVITYVDSSSAELRLARK